MSLGFGAYQLYKAWRDKPNTIPPVKKEKEMGAAHEKGKKQTGSTTKSTNSFESR